MMFVLALLGGCGPQTVSTDQYGANAQWDVPELSDGTLSYRSSYATTLDGVWAPAGRSWAVGGMTGYTCQLAYTNGTVGADLDLYGGAETVFDGVDSVVPSVLVGNGDAVRLFDFPWATLVDGWQVPGQVVSRLTQTGIVSVVETRPGCAVEFRDGLQTTSVAVADGMCDAPELDVDLASGAVFVTAGEVIAVTPEGAVTLGTGFDLAAWDPIAGQLYVARSGGTEVRALRADGSVVWAADVGGAVRGIDDLGANLAALVSIERGDASAFVLLDSRTGAPLEEQTLDRTAGAVEASADGSTIVLSHAAYADFFSIGDTSVGL